MSGVGMAGQGEEDVVEIRGVHRQPADGDRLLLKPVEQGFEGPDAAVVGDLQHERILIGRRLAEGAGGQAHPIPFASLNCSWMWPPGIRRLSSPAVPSATSLP